MLLIFNYLSTISVKNKSLRVVLFGYLAIILISLDLKVSPIILDYVSVNPFTTKNVNP